jgi:hypothetical protein
MEVFEVHITGDSRIHEAAKKYNIKSIEVELLRPDYSVLRTEHMTSHVFKFPNYEECIQHVLNLRDELKRWCAVWRVKVECPAFYEHYRDRSIYLESHFETKDNMYPISRNVKKTTLMGTDRTYAHEDYDNFLRIWKGQTLELALYDSFVEEDFDWLDMWGVTKEAVYC